MRGVGVGLGGIYVDGWVVGFVENMYVCVDTTAHCSALHCITPHCNTKVGCSSQERKRLMWWHSMTACLCRECCGKTCASGCYIDLTHQSSQGSRGRKYFCEIRQRSIRCGISKDVATVRVDSIHSSRSSQWEWAWALILEMLGWAVYGLGGYVRRWLGGWDCVTRVRVSIATYCCILHCITLHCTTEAGCSLQETKSVKW